MCAAVDAAVDADVGAGEDSMAADVDAEAVCALDAVVCASVGAVVVAHDAGGVGANCSADVADGVGGGGVSRSACIGGPEGAAVRGLYRTRATCGCRCESRMRTSELALILAASLAWPA